MTTKRNFIKRFYYSGSHLMIGANFGFFTFQFRLKIEKWYCLHCHVRPVMGLMN